MALSFVHVSSVSHGVPDLPWPETWDLKLRVALDMPVTHSQCLPQRDHEACFILFIYALVLLPYLLKGGKLLEVTGQFSASLSHA